MFNQWSACEFKRQPTLQNFASTFHATSLFPFPLPKVTYYHFIKVGFKFQLNNNKTKKKIFFFLTKPINKPKRKWSDKGCCRAFEVRFRGTAVYLKPTASLGGAISPMCALITKNREAYDVMKNVTRLV